MKSIICPASSLPPKSSVSGAKIIKLSYKYSPNFNKESFGSSALKNDNSYPLPFKISKKI